MASSSITSWQIDGETMEAVTDFIFLDSRITVDADCSHEVKRCLLLERKALTNLESILKSRDITLLTKIHVVKAIVFPVVIYWGKTCTIKKAEHWKIDAFELWWWRRLLRVPWTTKRSNQSILEEISPEYSLVDWCWSWNSNTLATWCEELTHWKRPWCWERLMAGEEGGDRGWDGWMAESEQTPGDGEGQGSLACCSPWGCKESDTTKWLNWLMERKVNLYFIYILHIIP